MDGVPLVESRSEVPVTVDASLCIEGCTLWVMARGNKAIRDHLETGKADMRGDGFWHCGPCSPRCPTGAVTVNMPYLLR